MKTTWATIWQNQQNECAPSEDSDQPGHPPSLIRVFAVRMKNPWVLSYTLSAKRRLWSDWAESSLGAHSFCWFCHVVAHFIHHSRSNSIQLFHACLGNSQNCCPEVPWTARCTFARGRQTEGNSASSCPRYRMAVVLSIPPNSHEITVLLPKKWCKSQCFRQEMLA